jgi:hypothetical protein
MELVELLNGGFQPKRYRPGGVGNWSGHLPFAHDLIAATKPNLLVELGTHYGESYFGFCQSVRENDIACSCYAIDTWVGEPQAGFYDESVYSDVSAYNSAHYSDFSYLLRATFDDSVAKFSENSIDVLHIDGLHTYQAVSHDLRCWLAKVKPGGVVLVHDVMVRHADFGVWKLWEELASTGQQFSFRHSWGLGVFRKSGPDLPSNPFLSLLFDSPGDIKEHVRKFYSLCATKLQLEHESLHRHRPAEGKLVVHVYPAGPNGYSADTAIHGDIQSGSWEHLSLEILQGTAYGALRIDPSEQPGLIDLSAVVLRRPADGEIMWSAKGSDELAALSTGGTLIRVNESETKEFARFFSHGTDPQLFLPLLETTRFDQPLLLEIWLRIDTNTASLLPILEDVIRLRASIGELEAELHESHNQGSSRGLQAGSELDSVLAERDTLLNELATEREERNALVQERAALLEAQDALVHEKNALGRQHESLAADLRRLQSELYVCRTDLKRKTTEEARLRAELAQTQSVLNQALASRSWRLTKPVRMLSEKLSGRR